jgi:hypothetical protein
VWSEALATFNRVGAKRAADDTAALISGSEHPAPQR